LETEYFCNTGYETQVRLYVALLTIGIRELHCRTRNECNLVLSCARWQLTFVTCMLL